MLTPGKNPPEKDVVMTPGYLARDIMGHFCPSGSMMDPCRGEGAFHSLMPEGSPWCEISEGVDFFDYQGKVDWVISNPPWSKIPEFIHHGMQVSDNVLYLAVLNHFTTRRRLHDIYSGGFGIKELRMHPTPPKPWTQSGFQVCTCHLRRGYKGPWTISNSHEMKWSAT